MAKTPYLYRRNNIYYFRFVVPIELRETLKVREIIKSLKTQNREVAVPLALQLAANVTTAFYNLKSGNISALSVSELTTQEPQKQAVTVPLPRAVYPQAPLLSAVVDDFLQRYDQKNKATLTKLKSTLPIFVELVGDKPVNQIFQADINRYFDQVQKLPVRRDAKIFQNMSIQKVIATHDDRCIAEGTFESTYRATVSLLINWASVHYKDQGFPDLSVQGAVYRGQRNLGINKQRALRHDEIKTLFTHPKMQKYAEQPETAHYCWLPLIGLFTGCRINEVCQLNPFTDIKQDAATGIWYFHFTDQGESAEGVNKSIKTNSSHRIVPIHSKLIELGILDYIKRMKLNGHKIIFPEWTPINGKASAKVSKWFIRYLNIIGLRDDTEGAKLSGFHCFRHTFITYGIKNKIAGTFIITGHETDVVDALGKISSVAKGYWTQGVTDSIIEKQASVERFDFGDFFVKPAGISC